MGTFGCDVFTILIRLGIDNICVTETDNTMARFTYYQLLEWDKDELVHLILEMQEDEEERKKNK